MIAEDDELILKTIEHKLLKEGHEVILTRNGKEAIETLKENDVDLAITDIMMPFASGIEILSAIKQWEKMYLLLCFPVWDRKRLCLMLLIWGRRILL